MNTTPTHTVGPVPRPALVNGIEKVSLIHCAQLTYLTFRNLSRYKKVAAGSVTLVLIPLLLAAVTYPTWLLSAALVALWLVLAPVGPLVGVWINTHPPQRWVVGLFSDTGTQLVRQEGSRWYLTDHFAWVRGNGSARAFRRDAFAELARQADLLGVTITMQTTVKKLKDTYLQDMPGLVVDRQVEDPKKKNRTVWHLIRHPEPRA